MLSDYLPGAIVGALALVYYGAYVADISQMVIAATMIAAAGLASCALRRTKR